MFLFFLQAIVSWFLAGLIWMVQLVHYPSFRFYSSPTQTAHQFHQQRISLIVVPMMLIELTTAVALPIRDWPAFKSLHLANLGLLAVIWLITFLFMVPLHRQLLISSSDTVIQQLVRFNWIRTLAWTIKAILWGGIIWHIISIS